MSFAPFEYAQRVRWLDCTADATAQEFWRTGKIQGTCTDPNKLFLVTAEGESLELYKEQLFPLASEDDKPVQKLYYDKDKTTIVYDGDRVEYKGKQGTVTEHIAHMVGVQFDGEHSVLCLRPEELTFVSRSALVLDEDAFLGRERGADPEFDQEAEALGATFMEKVGLSPNAKDSNPKDAVGIAKAYMSTVPQPVLWEVGVAMLEGALKYGRHNYRKAGVRASVYYDACKRHLDDWWEGEDLDPDSQLSHITKLIAGAVVLRDAMLNDMWTDDRPPRMKNRAWLKDLNEAAKRLLEKYPPETRKAPFTQAEHGGAGE